MPNLYKVYDLLKQSPVSQKVKAVLGMVTMKKKKPGLGQVRLKEGYMLITH